MGAGSFPFASRCRLRVVCVDYLAKRKGSRKKDAKVRKELNQDNNSGGLIDLVSTSMSVQQSLFGKWAATLTVFGIEIGARLPKLRKKFLVKSSL
jgi:hypothetical protein